MQPPAVFAILIALVALSTALGFVWKTTTGRARRGSGVVVNLPEVQLADRATLLQFSTEVCAPCKATHRVLGGIADSLDGVEHVDVDVTHRPEIASKFNILQTPTTLVLDNHGVIRARIGGAARGDVVRAELDRIFALA
jgi:thiol-disulfide isomerase/thioredoxin